MPPPPPPPIYSGLRQEASVYRRCLYCNEGSAGVERVGKLPSLGSPFNLLFLDKDEHFRSLNGHQLNLVTTRYIPYVDFKRHTEQPNTPVTLTSSLDALNLSTLSKILNFTYVVRKEPEASWGRYIDGNFTGMMGQLQREEVDLCTLCAITPERNQAINFLQVYPSDTITLVSLKPSYLSRHFLLVRPFTGIVWSGVVVAVVLWGSAMATFGWLLRREVQMRPVDYNAPFLLGWGALLEQSVAYQPVNVSRRVLVSVWLTFSLIVVSAYKSSLIANLSIQGKVDTPQTLRELTEAQGWEWATEDWVFRGYPYEYFSKHQHPIVKMVFQQIQIMPADEALKKVMKGRFSAFNYEKFITIYIKAHFTDALGRSPFQISKKPTSYVAAYGWGMRRGSPFYARFHQLVGRLRDAGIIAYWTEKETDRHTEKGTEEPFTYDSSGEYSKSAASGVAYWRDFRVINQLGVKPNIGVHYNMPKRH
ncbi:Glutamate receptor ionotropic, delta-2 [Chionoecetes opilio]|uniref:Glutamate receptor ionotropic, delta-2 n=1 Tax=Chionoecetes opilio TaxID=41210 RepID=A0A8J4XXZ8_CHIOP|nr:Glutamate receptor ionotropic, delta-2 [Chionoecetes opilio]